MTFRGGIRPRGEKGKEQGTGERMEMKAAFMEGQRREGDGELLGTDEGMLMMMC